MHGRGGGLKEGLRQPLNIVDKGELKSMATSTSELKIKDNWLDFPQQAPVALLGKWHACRSSIIDIMCSVACHNAIG